MFIHFNLVHITFNMIVLVQMGRIAERLFGNARFAALYPMLRSRCSTKGRSISHTVAW